jgi:hypothetical protein
MALADIYVLDHVQRYLAEPIHNLYTFERLGDGTAVELINAFQADLLPGIQILQCEQIVTVALKAYSLGDLGDLSEETINTPGGQDGEEMLPVFNAVNFTLKPASRAVRPGSKRIAGIPESVQADGTINSSPYVTAMESLRIAYGNEISVDETNFWRMVIVKRVKYNPDPEKLDEFAYRYPTAEDPLVFAPLRNVVYTNKVSHQVSRGNSR